MEKVISVDILLVNYIQGLIGLKESVTCENVYRLRVVYLQFFLDHHNKFEHCEGLQYQNPTLRQSLLAVVKLFQFRVAAPA